MRIYTESSEETLRARKLLKEWTGDGALTQEQYQRLEQGTASNLRTTNIFLRLVLFFFTVIAVAAAAALFFTVFLSRPSQQTIRNFLTPLRCCLLRGCRNRRSQGSSVSLWDRGSTRRLFGCFSLRRTGRSYLPLSSSLLARNSVSGFSRWRYRFALDLVPLQSLVRISRRDDLRHLPPRLLDRIGLGAACRHRGVVCSRTDLHSPHSLLPPLRLP